MIFKYILVFLIGFFSCALLFFVFIGFNSEIPFGTGFSSLNVSPPFDRVDREDIFVFDEKIILMIPNASLAEYAPTGSMEPLLGEGANGIRIVPENPSDVRVSCLPLQYAFVDRHSDLIT